MAIQFPGRLEAQYVVPTGGAAVSVSTGALSAAVTATLPAASYYHSAAGTITSGVTAFQTALNAAVSGYPQTAVAMAAAVGWGTWTSGAFWACQESSGSLAATFGAPSLTAVSSPTYGTAGPSTGGDLAIGFNSANDGFSGGNVFNVGATDDLILAWVGWSMSTVANADVAGKYNGAPGYLLATEMTRYRLFVTDGVNSQTADATGVHSGVWYVGIAVIDRSTNKMRVGTQALVSGTAYIGAESSVAAVGALTNAGANFGLGDKGVYGSASAPLIAGLYAVTGVGVATGLSANLATAVANFRNAISSTFTVSLSTTTGLTTISNSFWPASVSFTSTDLRDALGYAYNVGPPTTAAQVGTALGGWYSAFTTGGAGYLCDEASGNLASTFGTPASLTATSLTYSNLGARGGSDKAIGFDATTDNADGGNVFNVAATDDIIIVWVGYQASDPSSYNGLFSKYPATAVSGWYVVPFPSGGLWWYGTNAGGTASFSASNTGLLPIGEWYVGIACVDRSTAKARIGTRGLRSGTTSMSTEVAAAADAYTNATSFRVGQIAGVANAETGAKIGAFYITTGAGVAAGLSANLSTALSSFATYMKSQTSTKAAEGLWIPNAPLNLDDEPHMAPIVSDLRQTQSPTGNVIGLVGNKFYRHTNVRWPLVQIQQYRESSATYANSSFEHFWSTTQLAQGHAWFSPSSQVQIWWNDAGTDRLVGSDANSGTGVAGWTIVSGGALKDVAKRHDPNGYTGLWDIAFQSLVSSG